MEWLGRLETKDVITICVSIVALSFSIISTYITLRQKKYETERTLRNQLTDVLGKITALNLENAKIPQEGATATGLTSRMRGHLRDQQRFLVRQATYVIDQIPALVSPFEYLLVAGTFEAIDDVYQAEQFFRKAIEHSADDEMNRGITTRGFARFLFNQGEHELAREQYMASVEIFSGDSDIMKEYRGDTYLRWATQELEWSYPDNAKTYLSEAKQIFESKANPIARRRSVARLNDHIDHVYSSSLPAREKQKQPEVAAEDGAV
jgi:tetratricopeptide (TPR) repeat protein